MGDDDEPFDFHLSDPWIAAITPERIGRALKGFPLPLADDWTLARLTRAIQDRVGTARQEPPQGNAAAIEELTRLAKKAEDLRKAIARMGLTAEVAAFWEVVRYRQEIQNAESTDYDADYKPLILYPLDTIANILARAASQKRTERPQPPRWAERFKMDRRIGLAISLSYVFESAFNTPARANNWRIEYGEEHPWPNFYRRIYCEVFPEITRLNLAEVLQEAARQLPQVEEMQQWLQEQEAIRGKESDE